MSEKILLTNMKDLIRLTIQKRNKEGIDIYPPATEPKIRAFEKEVGFLSPEDFKKFYLICNGFSCSEDLFNILSLQIIDDYSTDSSDKWFYFSEYMNYSDMWGVRLINDGKYEIFNGSYPAIPMTTSLEEFLYRFFKENVFDDFGLYAWHEELGIKKNRFL